ncbi:MAG TPA: FAD-binding oxidoreductase [Pyrinomonadaceae bacterium]|nr:FAD-binding oxidoreductase [Pyrinomonadaceae bacterium]
MDRREFLSSLALTPLLSQVAFPARPMRRLRPGDPLWPSAGEWEKLKSAVGGRLIKLESPLAGCKQASTSAACTNVLKSLENPYYISDEPAYTQASGWLDAWTSAPSAYAVAAESTADVVAAVNFAREKNLRLVVKGGGHSYLGTSSSPDSLLIWTHRMNKITMHDSFLASGCKDAQPAVTIESGAVWQHAYNEVTTKNGRYVQGGGCATVGVAGLIQSGGFGSFSKNYGTGAAGLIEAEIVTADGKVRVVNACKEPDLFWALKGGGGGTFGVITKVTLRTRELPQFFGGVFGNIRATSDQAFRRLIARTMGFYQQKLLNRHWGEQIVFRPPNTMDIRMVFCDLDQKQAEETWEPFKSWLAESPDDFKIETPLTILAIPARNFWDASFWGKVPMQVVRTDDRTNAPAENIYWMGDAEQPGQFLHAYKSAWLPSSLLESRNQQRLVDTFFEASRYYGFSLHFNKGLAGAPAAEIEAARSTATSPDVLDAFALLITGSNRRAFPGVAGHEPDLTSARRSIELVGACMKAIMKVAPRAGSYVSESDFFEQDWQRSYWGSNYSRLASIKKKYDPDGLFFVHHGVGSETWSADGFERK